MKNATNPVDRVKSMNQAPRCLAKTRRGTPCQSPAIRGRKRCRIHGGKSPGAPRGKRHGQYKHGGYTIEALEENRRFRDMFREIKTVLTMTEEVL